MKNEKKIIGIVQPTYLPWLPFFERMVKSDIFIYLDDVEYSKNSYFNRNYIKGHNNRVLLTVPVKYSGHSNALINEIGINNDVKWRKKHCRSIQQYYSKAPFFNNYKEEIEGIYHNSFNKLIDINIKFIEFLKDKLSITTPCYLSSKINVKGKGNKKLVNLCLHFGGKHFIVKPNTTGYHPEKEFLPHGISFYEVDYSFFQYRQLHGDFIPGLSALDYLLNSGQGCLKQLI